MKETRKRKSRKILPLIFGIVGFLVIGATIAYNQNAAYFNNLFQLDSKEIDFVETFDSPDDWQPCQEIPKTAIAKNDAGSKVKIRLKYDEYWRSKEGEDMPLQKYGENIAIINFQNQADWEDGGDGWYYYKYELDEGEETNSFFKSVTMNCGMNTSKELKYCENDDGTGCDKDISEYSEAKYHVYIRMQAYQGEPPVEQYNVSIDPNGGTYNDSDEVYAARVDKGTEIDLSDIERDGYNFTNWTLNDSESYTESTITINSDTALVANWEQAGPQVARIERTGRIYPSIMAAHNEAQANDIITLLIDTEEVVTNEKTVTLNLDGHTVTGSLTNTANGNLTVLDGEINNPDGIAVTNNGTLTIGVNDYDSQNAAIIVNDYVRFVGTTVGLDQNGTFNYYDGYLEGAIGLDGGYNDTPLYHQTGEIGDIYYHPLVSYISARDVQHVELSANDNAVTKTIDGGEVYYYNLQDNINTSVKTGYRIYAIRDFDATYTVDVPENSEIVFDIAGFNVNFMHTSTNNGNFTILNSSTQSGSLNTAQTMNNNADLTLQDITIATSNANNTLKNAGLLTMRNAHVSSQGSGYSLQTASGGSYDLSSDSSVVGKVYNDTTDFEWTSGLMDGQIENTNDGIVTISGGIIGRVTKQYGCSISGGTVIINEGATIDVAGATCNADTTVNGGTISTYGSVAFSGGHLTINGGTMTHTHTSWGDTRFADNVTQTDGDVHVSGKAYTMIGYSGSVRMSGGTLTVEHTGNYEESRVFGISGTGEVSGGTITVTKTGNKPAVGVSTTTISGGTITVTSNTGEATGAKATTISGGTINAITKSGTAIGASDTRTISGGTITANRLTTGNAYGVKNNTGLRITDGTISGDTYGIYAEGGTTVLGDNTDSEVSITTPEIIGGDFALYGSKVSFYDGLLKGGTYAIYDGTVVAIPDGYTYHKENIDDVENCWLVEQTGFLEVNGQTYNSFEDAYGAITGDEGTVKFIDDADIENVIPAVPSGKTITIDLDGHEVTSTQTLRTDGTLIITDNSQSKSGSLTNTNTTAINGGGSLSIISTSVTGSVAAYPTGGSMNIKNSTIRGGVSFSGDYGTVTIEDSDIAGSTNVVNCSSNKSTMTISGTTRIYSENPNNDSTTALNNKCTTTIKDTVDISAIANLGTGGNVYAIKNEGTVIVKDNVTIGAMTANNRLQTNGIYGGIVDMQGGTVTVRDDESTSAEVIGVSSSNLKLSENARITAESYGGNVYGVYCGTNFTMTGGTVTAHGDISTTHGIYFVEDLGKDAYITGGTINAYSDNGTDSYGIHAYIVDEENVVITGGTVNGKKYGIYANRSRVVIGDNSDAVNINSPVITGGEYGLHNDTSNTGFFKFYDGTLRGVTAAYKEGVISAISEGYTYHKETIDGKENCWLVESEDYYEVDGNYYNSLGAAYNAITGNSGTITVVKDVSSEAAHPDSPTGKTITIDLNGHTLSFTQPIVNKSTMILEDSSQAGSGMIVNPNSSTNTIENYGSLTIESGTYSSQKAAVSMRDYMPTLTINGGVLSGAMKGVDCDYSEAAVVNMNHGTVSVNNSSSSTASSIYGISGLDVDIHMKNDASISVISSTNGVLALFGKDVTIENTANVVATTQATGKTAYGINAVNVSIKDSASITASSINGAATGTNPNSITMDGGTISATSISGASAGINGQGTTINGGTITATSSSGASTGISGRGTINAGTIAAESGGSGASCGISGAFTVTGSTITAQSVDGQAKGICVTTSGASIEGGTISATTTGNGSSYGVLATSSYSITGGTISGMYGLSGGTATIGDNTDGVVDATTPTIIASTYALGDGSYSFYDGILKGQLGINDIRITAMPDGYALHKETVTEGGVTYYVCYLTESAGVAAINGTPYPTLQAAVDAAVEDDIIDLISENQMNSELVVAADKVITIDTHGYDTLTNSKITINGKVGIVNSEYASDLSTFTLDGASTGTYFFDIAEGAELTIGHANISSAGYGFRNKGTLSIDSVDIESYSAPVYAYGPTTVDNSDLHGSVGMALNVQLGETTIQDSDLSGRVWVTRGKATIKDSTANTTDKLNSNYIELSNNGELTLDTVTFDMPYHFKQSNPRNEMSIINVAAGSTLTMKDTDVTVFPETDTNVKLNVINNKGTLNIDDSSIVLDSSQIDRYLTQLKMVENNGTINFKSGTISADIRNPSYGINNTSTGTVILGEAESPDSEDYGKETAHVSVTDPLISINTVIQYSSYGIYNNSGVIEFYDGKIAAYAAAMTPAAPNATEYMYEARAFTDENNNKYTILIWTPNQ